MIKHSNKDNSLSLKVLEFLRSQTVIRQVICCPVSHPDHRVVEKLTQRMPLRRRFQDAPVQLALFDWHKDVRQNRILKWYHDIALIR
jgi:hypothetical protein